MGAPGTGGADATYAAAGVDLGAAESAVDRLRALVASTSRPGVVGPFGGFGALFELDTERYRHPLLVSSTDGVGTKLLVAKALGRYDTVGIDLVAMCVDDLVCTGAEPLFLLDYVAVGSLDPDRLAELVGGIAAGCRRVGCALVGGETAEHPGAMAPGDLDVAGFALGVVERGQVLGPDRVRAGDLLVGLLSPGLRSNGYSLARHVLLESAGRPLAGEAWPGAGRTLGDVLLEPSVLYTPGVRRAVAAAGPGVRACAHVTGGGLAANLSRALPPTLDAVVERSAWATPRIFAEIARAGRVDDAEMARVFNMGVGMVLVVDPGTERTVRAALADEGVASVAIGTVTEGEGRVWER